MKKLVFGIVLAFAMWITAPALFVFFLVTDKEARGLVVDFWDYANGGEDENDHC